MSRIRRRFIWKVKLQSRSWRLLQACCCSTIYQLVDFKELDLKCVPDDKVCTDVLQQWHVSGEAANSEAVLFSNLTFEKSDF